MAQASDATVTTCYRHSNRETGVSCSNCGRPICPDCMTPTPVGMRCPECSKQKTKVHTASSLYGAPQVIYVLIAINAIAYLVTSSRSSQSGTTLYGEGVLYGPYVADGEWWRIVSSGFLHADVVHILLNMVLLYFVGVLLEPAIGRVRFLLVYFVSLVGGSLGALLLTPNDLTVGASGAVFGLMGAAVLLLRSRGIGIMQSGLGITLLLNLVLTFRPGISYGGHLGGLLAGGLLAYFMIEVADRRRIPRRVVYGMSAVVLVALFAGGILVARAAPPPTF